MTNIHVTTPKGTASFSSLQAALAALAEALRGPLWYSTGDVIRLCSNRASPKYMLLCRAKGDVDYVHIDSPRDLPAVMEKYFGGLMSANGISVAVDDT